MSDPSSAAPADWVKLASYGTGLEAERAVVALEEAGVPAITRAHAATGVFGPGYMGPTAAGVDVLVPVAAVDRAWSVVVTRGG